MSGLLKQLEQLVQECSKFNTLEHWINSIDSAQNSEGQNFGKNSSGEGGTNNRINIMTMHGSKGLEFKAVFIVDANQGIIPTSKALRERNFEEERICGGGKAGMPHRSVHVCGRDAVES